MKRLWIIYGVVFFLLLLSCAAEPEEELMATVEGTVYADSTMTIPQPDVMVKIKIDNGEYVPDVIGYTDSDGHFSVSFYLGHEFTGSGFKPRYTANIEVFYFYGGYYFKFSEITVRAGETYRLPAVHLGMFEEYSGG